MVFDSVLGSFPLNDQFLRVCVITSRKRAIPLAKGDMMPFAHFVIPKRESSRLAVAPAENATPA